MTRRGARRRRVISASDRFSWGSQTKAKARATTDSQATVTRSGKGSPGGSWKSPPGASCRDIGSSGSWGSWGEDGRPEDD